MAEVWPDGLHDCLLVCFPEQVISILWYDKTALYCKMAVSNKFYKEGQRQSLSISNEKDWLLAEICLNYTQLT